jgi:hypothetical protein
MSFDRCFAGSDNALLTGAQSVVASMPLCVLHIRLNALEIEGLSPMHEFARRR